MFQHSPTNLTLTGSTLDYFTVPSTLVLYSPQFTCSTSCAGHTFAFLHSLLQFSHHEVIHFSSCFPRFLTGWIRAMERHFRFFRYRRGL